MSICEKYGKIRKVDAMLEYKRIEPSIGNFKKNKEILPLLEVCAEWGKNKLFYMYVIYRQ